MTDTPEYITVCNKDQTHFPKKFLQIKPEGLLEYGFTKEEINPHMDVDEMTYLTLKKLYRQHLKPYHYTGPMDENERRNIL